MELLNFSAITEVSVILFFLQLTYWETWNTRNITGKVPSKLFSYFKSCFLLGNISEEFLFFSNPAGNYMFKVNNRNIRTRCEICSNFTPCSSASIVNFEQINAGWEEFLIFICLSRILSSLFQEFFVQFLFLLKRFRNILSYPGSKKCFLTLIWISGKTVPYNVKNIFKNSLKAISGWFSETVIHDRIWKVYC